MVLRLALVFLLALGALAPGAARAGAYEEAAAQRLAEAEATYRAIALRGGWPAVPDGPTLESGQSGPRIAALRARLAVTGELAGGALAGGSGGDAYDAGLAEAVRRFQRRHGLEADGRAGRETLAALNVDVGTRVAQLGRAAARWRSLPDLGAAHVQVNIAAMLLDVVEDGRRVLRMPVVVGDVRHPTPVFSSRIAGVVFNPDWTVPPSIIAKEMLPRLRREPGYLAASRIRILDRPEDPFGATVDWRARDARARLGRLRQDPGPGNALGLVKFDIPNPHDIYLHDTPSKRLFARAKRAFSHGCIRVSRPRELAAWVLGIDAEAVDRAIAAGATTRVPAPRDIPVHVLYLTAFVDPDGTVQFRDDLYGLDAAAPDQGSSDPVGCVK